MKRHRTHRTGFTLLEVLLVVGILALLAAVVAPRLIGTQQQAQVDTTKSQIAMFEDVMELYLQQNGAYPSTEQGLESLIEEPDGTPKPRSWAGPYLRDGEMVDPWGSPYQYSHPGDRNSDKPDIWSIGPDGEEETEDDIGNWKNEDEEDDGEFESDRDDSRSNSRGSRAKRS